MLEVQLVQGVIRGPGVTIVVGVAVVEVPRLLLYPLALDLKIQHVGGLIRKLKNEKAGKETVKAEVDVLLFLKNCYKVCIRGCLYYWTE